MQVKRPLYAKYRNERIGWARLATRIFDMVSVRVQEMIVRGSYDKQMWLVCV